jgi:hypothetical protein
MPDGILRTCRATSCRAMPEQTVGGYERYPMEEAASGA